MRFKKLANSRVTWWVAILLIVIVPLSTPILIDSWKFWRLTQSFASLKHPSGTSRVKFVKGTGQLLGNGNNINYLVGEVRTYSGTKARIESFYSGVAVHNPLTHRAAQYTPVAVEFIEGGRFPGEGFPYNFQRPQDWSLPSRMLNQKLYIVYVLETEHETFWG